ncbi:unnamed protein product [Brachionus calyciflorus]|uniref:SWIM-type domain-containing protein n=1 Tax=Brachionus calyciflorus TaxID=104777 RepID=A0A814ILA3_9BILA|nr:unnamed protein product [Brachionus calyciflorus]
MAFITDNASYMLKAFKTVIKTLLFICIHVTCFAHIINLVGETWRPNLTEMDSIVANLQSIFVRELELLKLEEQDFNSTDVYDIVFDLYFWLGGQLDSCSNDIGFQEKYAEKLFKDAYLKVFDPFLVVYMFEFNFSDGIKLKLRDEWKIYSEICSELVKQQKPNNFDLKQWWKDHQIEDEEQETDDDIIPSAVDCDNIIPSRVHEILINEYKISETLLPSLKQVQNFVNNYRYTKFNRNSIKEVRKLIQNNLFSEDLDEHEPFFFNVKFDSKNKIIINNGSEEKHINLMVTTKHLMSRIDSNLQGCYHLDATYKLIKNGFPLIVLGRTDSVHDFHPLGFCISSHEQEVDYYDFFQGFKTLSGMLDIEFDPNYLVQDAWLASYNAVSSHFDNCRVLMCYFHVIFNCRKEYRKLTKVLSVQCKNFLKKMHYSINLKDMEQNFRDFKNFSKDNCQEFYMYVKNQWLTGPFKRWQIFNRPEGFACTNSPIESFNRSIKRTFTKKKRMFVLDFVQVLLRIARYYSIKNSTFHTRPVPNSKAKLAGIKYSKKGYFRKCGKDIYKFSNNEEYFLNMKDKTCNCKYFRKDAICGHLIGLDSVISNDNFVNKPKKGAQKKAKEALVRD